MIIPLVTTVASPDFDRTWFSEPGKRTNLTNLWCAARHMYERITTRITPAAELARRIRFGHRERRDLLNWLVPIEKLVRAILVTRAITYLLMTVQARKLLRDTPKVAPPEPPKPPPRPNPNRIVMPHPGWHTIWQSPSRTPAPAPEERPEAPPKSPFDPGYWACRFAMPRWQLPQEDGPRKPPRKSTLPRKFLLMKEGLPDPHLLYVPRPQKKIVEKLPGHAGARSIAKRIEALGRVIANPDRYIMRLARFIASLPHGALSQEEPPVATAAWAQARYEFRDAVALMLLATAAYYRTIEDG
jgi:hypothetical protein